MFENNLIAGVSGQGGGYSINDSLRFNDNDSANLSRTPATAGNRKTWTWSGWVKRGNLGLDTFLFDASIGGSEATLIRFVNNDKIRLYTYDGTSSQYFDTTALFRDVSGWYHVVFVHDTTQAGADKLKLYINGIRQAGSTTGSIADNSDGYVNSTIQHNLGRFVYGANQFFDGYMAEINFIDGQALTPDDFGEINADTGEWSPKRYSGTYGTNGFYLPFDGNANDDSGNGNNWTENNLASTDYMLDTPTNNFSVFNPLVLGTSQMVLSQGNLDAFPTSSGASNYGTTFSTFNIPSTGKFYAEFRSRVAAGLGNSAAFGVVDSTDFVPSSTAIITDVTTGEGFDGARIILFNDTLEWYSDGVSAGVVTGITASSAIGMLAIDVDSGKVWVGVNGVWANSGNPVAGTGEIATRNFSLDDVIAANTTFNGTHDQAQTANFGADSSFAGNETRQGNTDANGIGDFYYEPPAGFLALCENNLPTSGVVASGGTETTIIDGGRYYKVHTFTSSGTLTVSSGGEVEYLVVAGGGGGGAQTGGGGGAGGVLTGSTSISTQTYTIVVGAGGNAAPAQSSPPGGSSGGNSSAFSVTPIGGGGGGSYQGNTVNSDSTGKSGGSGGGGAALDNQGASGGSGTSGQGNSGGNGNNGQGCGSNYYGGGGGGAGAAGSPSTCTAGSGDGGNGVSSSISGSSVLYAGGGGGCGQSSPAVGSGGSGGGGDGGNNSFAATAGSANKGGGGGGGRDFGGIGGGAANGGSGIVIIRYAV